MLYKDTYYNNYVVMSITYTCDDIKILNDSSSHCSSLITFFYRAFQGNRYYIMLNAVLLNCIFMLHFFHVAIDTSTPTLHLSTNYTQILSLDVMYNNILGI